FYPEPLFHRDHQQNVTERIPALHVPRSQLRGQHQVIPVQGLAKHAGGELPYLSVIHIGTTLRTENRRTHTAGPARRTRFRRKCRPEAPRASTAEARDRRRRTQYLCASQSIPSPAPARRARSAVKKTAATRRASRTTAGRPRAPRGRRSIRYRQAQTSTAPRVLFPRAGTAGAAIRRAAARDRAPAAPRGKIRR